MSLDKSQISTDQIFAAIHSKISNLELLPGAKLSEAETAQNFGVSRQPVRDVFRRLETQGLLTIQPQKATRVRGFSVEEIDAARLVRSSIEFEVLRIACSTSNPEVEEEIKRNLEQQAIAAKEVDVKLFHKLDYDFHYLLFRSAGCEHAFETVSENKAKVDRLCALQLDQHGNLATLLSDHHAITDGLLANDIEKTIAASRAHFSRLDETIENIQNAYPHYFEMS